MKIIKLLLTSLAMICFSFTAEAEKFMPDNFEKIYEEILTNKEYANLGNPEGKYVLVEFFDYRCQYCKKNHFQISKLIQEGKLPNVRWISIEAPVLGLKHNIIAHLVYASKKQNKYKELFEKIATLENPTITDIENFAKELEIDKEQLWKDASDEKIEKVFEKNLALLHKFNFEGVPLMLLNKKVYLGALSEKGIQRVIRESNNMD